MPWKPTRRRVGLGLLAGLVARPALSRPGPPLPGGLTAGPAGVSSAVLAGDMLELSGLGTVVLAGVQAPQPERHGAPAWPLAVPARDALAGVVGSERLHLHFPADREDRWGRLQAHLVTESGHWVQGALLMRGWLRVRVLPGTEAGARTMLDLERTARAGRAGIWRQRFYRIRNPSEAWGDLDSFQIVEGRVVDGATVSGTGYLNFGEDWRQDFTLRIPRQHRRAFRAAGIVPEDLVGRRVRGRGWVFPRNGPMIDLVHPAQLEMLEE